MFFKSFKRFLNLEDKKGFTLIETLVGTAVFLVVATAVYQAYVSVFTITSATQYKILGLNLANEQFEIIRNLPYSDVGEVSGIPNGKVPHVQQFVRGGITFTVTTTIRNVDLPFDGTIDGTPDDLSPADNKLIEVEISCSTCRGMQPITLTTTVAPKNLETASTNGALFIKVFDANGKPVSDANIHVVNSKVTPNIIIDDVTDVNGMLAIVDAPPGLEAYAITVSKNGYSTDRTYATSSSNINPTKPNATVIVQQVTQVSFSIDKVSNLTIKSVGPTCESIPSFDFNIVGSKTIGVNIPKFNLTTLTNSSGIYNNNSIEWDSYNITGLDTVYEIIGLNPLNPNNISPDSTEEVMVIAQTKQPNSLLVTVKDSSTGLPITGATVRLYKEESYSETKTTDRGYKNQTDWSEGGGQALFTDLKKFFYNDGNIDIASPQGELKLLVSSSTYPSSGYIESSTIDTGSPSNFYKIVLSPTDQPLATGSTSVKVQIATNTELNASTTWNYIGPDGTNSSFYTVNNNTISSVHNGGRYIRYKLILSTENNTVTPSVSDISITFTSDCTPPGQVIFNNLANGTYSIEVSKTDYSSYNSNVSISTDWQEKTVTLSP